MDKVVLVIHLILALSLIVLVLIQRSEGGGLGMGGSGGLGNVASARGAANVLTRATSICFALFVVTSLTLAIFAGQAHRDGSLIDKLDSAVPAQTAPVTVPDAAPEAPAPETAPVETPKVPISQ